MHTSTSTIRRAPIVLTVLLPIVMLAMPIDPGMGGRRRSGSNPHGEQCQIVPETLGSASFVQ